MCLDLVDGGDNFGSLEEFLEATLVKIGDTDSLNFTGIEKFFHRSPGIGDRDISECELAGFGMWELLITRPKDNWPVDLRLQSVFVILDANSQLTR